MQLQGKVALVTGAAQGFGFAIAETYARLGAQVMLCDVLGDKAAEAARTLGHHALAGTADVSKARDVRTIVNRTIDAFGRLDIAVNNAGVTHRNQPMLEVDEQEFDRVYATNVKSIFHMAHAVVPLMRAQGGGSIINIGSTAAIRPRPGLTWYNGSKGAVHLISKSMAVELAPDNIRVNVIAPVAGETPLLATFMGEDTPERRAAFRAVIPLGRFSQPQDIANAALYLASDEAQFLTGVILEVDGGRCI